MTQSYDYAPSIAAFEQALRRAWKPKPRLSIYICCAPRLAGPGKEAGTQEKTSEDEPVHSGEVR